MDATRFNGGHDPVLASRPDAAVPLPPRAVFADPREGDMVNSTRAWRRMGLAAMTALGLFGQAPDESRDLFKLSLQELMNIQVNTATYQSSSWREQPGIITIYTAADIQAMGALTLRDVLTSIPGVSLGMDNRNAVNLMFRGNWGLEGKILYVWNELPVNDVIFGTYPIPPYIPADLIDRIEILRGPGSAKYGDSAQLAVIRIYTKKQAQDSQVSLTTLGGTAPATNMVSFNQRIGLGGSGALAVAGSANRGRWSDAGTWIDAQGTAVKVRDSGTHGANVAADGELGDTRAQVYYDYYTMNSVQVFGITDPTSTVWFRQCNAALLHTFSFADTWKVVPRVSYRSESTWKSAEPDQGNTYDIRGQRVDAGLEATHRYRDDASVTLGCTMEWQKSRFVDFRQSGTLIPLLRPDGEKGYHASTLYATWDLKVAGYNLTLGGRAIDHSYSGSAFTPRMALTRSTDDWHFKVLYGQAFRTPNSQQIDTNSSSSIPPLKPEQTTVHELEFGHAFGTRGYLTGTLFSQSIKDAIIYTPQGFTNNVQARTNGIEVQYWYRSGLVSFQANASHTRSNDDDIPLYDVAGRSGQFVGAAADIANLWSSWSTGLPNLRLLLGARLLGPRTAKAYSPGAVDAASGLPVAQHRLAAETTLNLGLRYELSRLSIAVGVRNLTDAVQFIPQPYNDISTPFPFGAREWWLRVSWRPGR